ncbi:MAG TPA: tyrosine-type recombinase/integrase [Terriglobia bacterium]|nr:tyrosine-type recombinase/integrase [Terriglobia bacterium]
MKLIDVANEFLSVKRSVGMRFRSEARGLKTLCRRLGDMDMRDIEPAQICDFINGKGPVTAAWHYRFGLLRRFYRFALSRGYVSATPLPKIVPKRPPPCPPYIYTLDELRRLLVAIPTLCFKRTPFLGEVFRALFLMLYGTGLRIHEAVSLTFGDVDLVDQLITVYNTKFFKSRLVPIGPRLAQELSSYVKQRWPSSKPPTAEYPFFALRKGTSISDSYATRIFRRLRRITGIKRADGARYQPRVHDIRHTAAVHRLVAWYRQGEDVQRLLPHLSTYLGHVDLAATQRYLSMTPELLREANRRFEHYAFKEIPHV